MTTVNINILSMVLMGIINGVSFAIGIFLYEYFTKKFFGKDKVQFTFRNMKKRLFGDDKK